MTKRLLLTLFLVLMMSALLISGCTRQEPQPAEEEAPVEEEVIEEMPGEQVEEAEVPQEEAHREELPESVEITILIEGMEEEMTLLLFQEEDMPFYTYYPEDMLSEHWIDNNEKGVRFFANFGGTINESAYVDIKLFPVESVGTEAEFIDRISGESGLLANQGVEWVEKESEMERIFPWSIIEYYYLNDEFVGSLYLGEHQDDYFYIDVHYPWEYGDGMEARVNHIMQGFHWNQGEKLLQLSD